MDLSRRGRENLIYLRKLILICLKSQDNWSLLRLEMSLRQTLIGIKLFKEDIKPQELKSDYMELKSDKEALWKN